MAKTITNVLVGVATLSFKYPTYGAYVEVGYTKDGVTLEYAAETMDIDVLASRFPIARPIVKETLSVKCNMSEGSLTNIDKAIAGSVLAGSVITIGGGVQKEMSIKIVGVNPAGFARTIEIPLATAVGTVGQAFKKGMETFIPVEFQALKGISDVCTITDATA